MSRKASFPWWLKPVNRMVILLNRLGLSIGTMHILSIPGRKTGKMRSTPVSVLKVNGQRYILTGRETGWVKNARAAGWGLLSYGRKKERVALIELPVEERPPILREFPVRFQVACQCLSAYSTCPAIQRRSRRLRHGVPCFALIMQMPTWLLQADLQDTA